MTTARDIVLIDLPLPQVRTHGVAADIGNSDVVSSGGVSGDVVGTDIVVGYSGGLDSTALLHLLARRAQTPAGDRTGLRAIHIDHGLHPDSEAWASHCRAVCAELGVALEVIAVAVDRRNGLGPEAAARQARRAAFAQALRPGDILALAQHRDDQAETFLLRALRGSGIDGLAAMRPWRAFEPGWLWRPLLATPRATLRAYAEAHGLRWIEDPSNADPTLDRNFLRHRVLPLLRERWPHTDTGFARAAALAANDSDLLLAEDARALYLVRDEVGDSLSLRALRALPAARRARILRHWVAERGWPPLPAEGVERVEIDLLDADHDALPAFAWSGVEIRRWRESLYLRRPGGELPADWSTLWDGRAPLPLPNGDRLELRGLEQRGGERQDGPSFPAPVRVHPRRGGERIAMPDRDHHHALKHLLQEAGVPPWERPRMPLLSAEDGTLLAAGDQLRSDVFDAWLQAYGAELVWARSGNR
jgi:tRNA(Ile)-lysidine synthase